MRLVVISLNSFTGEMLITARGWRMVKEINEYISPDVQKECLQLMAMHILCEVSQHIAVLWQMNVLTALTKINS